ncbi:MAG: saccharopine dehydrogenase C-terminal domain-containing protein [Candidatus Palauibacterales bacterium]|nr:saccharopine dehydrogenase C-terminal domain-containing protein [Candidatus Palauibacterales bacterium]
MRFLILGGGLQGTACAYDLLRQDDVERVTIADLERGADDAPDFLPDDDRLRWQRADFADEDDVRRAMSGHRVALSAAPYFFNDDLARLAIDEGLDYSDLGGNTEIVFRQMDRDGEARDAGVTQVPDVGLAPGIVNVLAAEAVRRLDRAESVRMFVGGLPQNPRPPLDYQVVYSLRGALDYYTTPSSVIRDGRRRQVEALSEVEELEFDGLGALEAFHTAGGASVLPWRLEGRVERLEYKTLRYPGHARIMEAIRELGLLSREPVDVDGREVVPRDVFVACARPKLEHPDEPDLVALRVVGTGERDGRDVTLTWNLLDREDEETGISAMMRCTGYSLAVVGLMLGRDEIERTGVLPPDEGIPYGPFVEALADRGVEIRLEESEGG